MALVAVDLALAIGAAADPDRDVLVPDVLALDADASGAVADGADDHHVRDVERRRLRDHATRLDLRAAHAARVPDRARLRVPLDDVQVLDHDAALGRARLEDAALLAAILAAQDLDEVAFLHAHARPPSVRVKNVRVKKLKWNECTSSFFTLSLRRFTERNF